MKKANENNNSPVVRLKATAKEFSFSNLRPDQDHKSANSGETMFLDLQRMNFVINGKEIDRNLIIALKEGVKHRKSELFNSDDIYSDEIFNKKGTREIDTDDGKALVASILEDIEKELVSDALDELWKDHCTNPETTDHQKTDSYRKEFEKFYNIGQKYIHLAPKANDENKNYRPLVGEFVKEIFEYAGAKVSSKIVDEFITSCNQAGYEAAPFMQVQLPLMQSFIVEVTKKAINIDCIDPNNVSIRSDTELPVFLRESNGMRGDKICDLSNSLEFTLEGGKDVVTYRDGKLSLTIPEELKKYKDNGKNLFDIIKEYFETFCAKLGFKFETKIQIEHDLGPSLKVLDNIISTTGSDANEKFINLLSENLRDRLLRTDSASEDVNDFVEIKVSTVMDLLSDYAKLEDNKENRELLINEVADNLVLSTQDKTASEVLMELSSLPSLIRGPVNYNQVQSVANIFADLIIGGKREIYEGQKGAINPINAIHNEIEKAIVEQEEKKATSKQDVEGGKWTHMIEEQKSSMKSHEHSH